MTMISTWPNFLIYSMLHLSINNARKTGSIFHTHFLCAECIYTHLRVRTICLNKREEIITGILLPAE